MTETELQAIEARRQCCLGTGRARETEASLADIPALCAEVRRLRKALLNHGTHTRKCGKHFLNLPSGMGPSDDPQPFCSCGFDAALGGAE